MGVLGHLSPLYIIKSVKAFNEIVKAFINIA